MHQICLMALTKVNTQFLTYTVNFFLTAQVPLNEIFGRELAT